MRPPLLLAGTLVAIAAVTVMTLCPIAGAGQRGLEPSVSLARGPMATANAPLPQVYQLACDTVSVDPLQVRFTFGVLNLDPAASVCDIIFWAEDQQHVLACATEVPEWGCYVYTPTQRVNWLTIVDPPDCMLSGEHREPYSFVSDSASPLFFARFDSPIIGFGDQYIRFHCPDLVPTRRSSWGMLKAIYR